MGEGHDGCLGGRVWAVAGVGADSGDGSGADDAAVGYRLLGRGLHHGWGGVFGGKEDAQGVDPEDVHEVIGADLVVDDIVAGDAGIGEEDVETAIALERVVHDGLDLGLVGGIKCPSVDLDSRERGVDLLLVNLEVSAVKVAEVDGTSAALGELMGSGSADSASRVGSCDNENRSASLPCLCLALIMPETKGIGVPVMMMTLPSTLSLLEPGATLVMEGRLDESEPSEAAFNCWPMASMRRSA